MRLQLMLRVFSPGVPADFILVTKSMWWCEVMSGARQGDTQGNAGVYENERQQFHGPHSGSREFVARRL